MKILLDEDIPQKLTRFLSLHEVHTVVSMQWGGVKNGALLALLEREMFQIFVTGDKNMRNQHQLGGRPFAVLVLPAINWPVIEPHLEVIKRSIETAESGTVTMIDCGEFVKRSKRNQMQA